MREIKEIKDIFRKNCIRMMAVAMCKIAHIEPIDSLDGSSNWWMFNDRATKLVDDIMQNFPIPDEIYLESANEKNPRPSDRGHTP